VEDPWISLTDHHGADRHSNMVYGAGGNRGHSRSIRNHFGANVYIRMKVPKLPNCARIDGGGWQLVRHVPQGGRWHPARDRLRGTARYGRRGNAVSPWAWSVRFHNKDFNEFLFATGDCKRWLIAKKYSVLGWYSNGHRWIQKSSRSSRPYRARWYRRHRSVEDPWVSITDHHGADRHANMVYGSGSFHHHSKSIRRHYGANVFIRKKVVKLPDCSRLAGGGWRLVRHVPDGQTWHPARDYLQGTARYGRKGTATSSWPWSVRFHRAKFNEFLLTTGDCQKWLVAKKHSVFGWYSNAPRWIDKSSRSGRRYQARWYRRKGAREDPWISITNHHGADSRAEMVYGEGGHGGHSRSIRTHHGANVFIRQKTIKVPNCAKLAGGGWKLVRHTPEGGRWHPATDRLRGTQAYGRKGSQVSSHAWSIRFNRIPFNEFLFATGDCKKWLVAKRHSVYGWYANAHRWIVRSSISKRPYRARWYRRPRNSEDPWISITDHGGADRHSNMVYGGRNGPWHTRAVRNHVGANVYIRFKVPRKLPDCSKLRGGGWRLVRHVPEGNHWHPARDQLRGTQAYGRKGNAKSPHPWSVRFDKMRFNEFLFASGDCKVWLVAKKWSVMGWYNNAQRRVEASSWRGRPYHARWYRRHRNLEDPWVSLTDHHHGAGRGHMIYGENRGGYTQVLRKHFGANVFIRYKAPPRRTCRNIQGGGWRKVRHVPAGYQWHPATDRLRGTQSYGRRGGDDEWSVKFHKSRYNEFLFATGDCKKWLIAPKYSVVQGWYNNHYRQITKSSWRNRPYLARWYRRSGSKEDPWISIRNHGYSTRRGMVLYGGNRIKVHTQALRSNDGADVYIRYKKPRVKDCSRVDGGGWQLVRHVPPGYCWHKARDQLSGHAAYGIPGTQTSLHPFSVRFAHKKFNEFMFATGDCKKWLIAPRTSVIGWYSNGRRDVLKSSISSGPHKIRWYRRQRQAHDPLIGLRDYHSAVRTADILYASNRIGGSLTRSLRAHYGANVYIRNKVAALACQKLDGGRWIQVRHVPAGLTWHPAKDFLRGTAVYGKKSKSITAPAWSVRFDRKQVKEFLFASGDCTKWLIAPSKSVYGWYKGKRRYVKKSSVSGRAYKARWYRRKGQWTDPWITTRDFEKVKVGKGNILYAGGGIAAGTTVVQHHSGADVYVRY